MTQPGIVRFAAVIDEIVAAAAQKSCCIWRQVEFGDSLAAGASKPLLNGIVIRLRCVLEVDVLAVNRPVRCDCLRGNNHSLGRSLVLETDSVWPRQRVRALR